MNPTRFADGSPCLAVFVGFFLSGCMLQPGADRADTDGADVAGKLARVGIEVISEDEAHLPANERGRYIPCRVIPGFRRAALEEHPAGYLLVGVGDSGTGDAGAIRQALAAWKPGEFLEITVRRNPHLSAASVWWERDVKLYLPK